jgi:hypothetical protein
VGGDLKAAAESSKAEQESIAPGPVMVTVGAIGIVGAETVTRIDAAPGRATESAGLARQEVKVSESPGAMVAPVPSCTDRDAPSAAQTQLARPPTPARRAADATSSAQEHESPQPASAQRFVGPSKVRDIVVSADVKMADIAVGGATSA